MAPLRIVDFVGTDPDQNLLIEGNARESLDAIESHSTYADRLVGHVKLAYLDPPYNTGNNFKHYRDRLDSASWNTNLKEILAVSRRFLAPGGSLWLHLNDSEQHRARLVLDEVFGPRNFVTTIIWIRTQMPRLGGKQFATRHDYIHVYRNTDEFSLPGRTDTPVETIWSLDTAGSNEQASAESKDFFGEQFSTPKPEQLLRKIIELTTKPGDVVLDCFAGSGTTAAVAHKLGRSWVTVELEAGTVENFVKPRLRRVVNGTDPVGISPAVGWVGGGGFTHLVASDSEVKSRGVAPQA